MRRAAGRVLHDLGKANDQFQAMVRHRRKEPQGLRHEWVSLLMVEESNLYEWLLPAVAAERLTC